jgi:hypothetical protein
MCICHWGHKMTDWKHKEAAWGGGACASPPPFGLRHNATDTVRIRTVESQQRALPGKRDLHPGFLPVTIQKTCVPPDWKLMCFCKSERAPSMQILLQDLRYALRMLRKNPGFMVVAVLRLALGIGANTAIFTVVNAVLLRPLPYPEPDRIAQLMLSSPAWDPGRNANVTSIPKFMVWREQTQIFKDIAAYDDGGGVNCRRSPGATQGSTCLGGLLPAVRRARRNRANVFRRGGPTEWPPGSWWSVTDYGTAASAGIAA